MMRKLKTIGLAAISVLALSAVVASAAHAQFTASAYPKTATREGQFGNETMITEAGAIQCKAHFAVGPLNAGSLSVTVTLTQSECKAFDFTTTVQMNGCDYTFHDTDANHLNNLSINCPAGKSITLSGGPCEWTIPAQGPLGNVSMTTAGNHIDLQFNLTGIAYTVTKDGFLCPFNGTGAKTGASLIHHNPVTLTPIGGGSISVD